jgi:flavodoxin I
LRLEIMKIRVVFDSVFGNTEKIARAMGGAFESMNVEVLSVNDVNREQMEDLDVLIVGSPTRKFKPTAAIKKFLRGIPSNGLDGVKVAGFDTRIPDEDIAKSRVLPFFVRLFGYAAKPILANLVKKGGKQALPPEGFYVGGIDGPLVEGELERAALWAKRIIS